MTVKPADLVSSKIVGINVYNNQNETLGRIEDLVIENGKTIIGVVVSVGGFLGIGESYVAVEPSSLVLHQKMAHGAHSLTRRKTISRPPSGSYADTNEMMKDSKYCRNNSMDVICMGPEMKKMRDEMMAMTKEKAMENRSMYCRDGQGGTDPICDPKMMEDTTGY